MGFCNEGFASQCLAWFIVSHVDDAHCMGGNLSVRIEGDVKTHDFPSEVPGSTDQRIADSLAYRVMGMANNQCVDFRTEFEDFVCTVASEFFVIFGVHAYMGYYQDKVDFILDDVDYLPTGRSDGAIDEGIYFFAVPAGSVGVGKPDDSHFYP